MRTLLLITGLVLSAASFADGKVLHDSACLQCHASLGGGNSNQLYQRPERTVKSLSGLRKRVKHCMLAADVSWDKKQQEAVVQYLQSQFYKF